MLRLEERFRETRTATKPRWRLRRSSINRRPASLPFNRLLLYGRAVPDLDLTVEMSELLIKPFTVTSVRKLLKLAVVPLCALV
jgi:hypothetical protein